MADTSKETAKEEAPAYVWMDAGHVAGGLDDVRVQKGMVAVDPNTGVPLEDQPDYPPDPEPPEPEPEQPAPTPAKSTTTKSAS